MAVRKKKEEDKRYNLSTLLRIDKYKYNRDLLTALLNDNEVYSIIEVDTAISDFLKRKVN